MKKLKCVLTIMTILFINFQIFAQVPQKFNYQAVCRNNTGAIIANQPVDFRLSIHDLTPSGVIVYQETQSASTNVFGLVNLAIGSGNVQIGTFSAISWGTNDKYLEVEIDLGSGFISMGTNQLLSVPYSLYAKTAGNISFDIDFPDGFSPDSLILLQNVTSYTVPANKNLYITAWESNPYFNFTVDNAVFNNISYSAMKPHVSFVLGAGMTFNTTNPTTISGFFTNKSVQYLSINLSQGNYIVPNNKILVICYFSNDIIQVNSIGFTYGPGIVDKNSIISGTGSLIGYLLDK